jgi:uncharacterized metal-binding protein YceD (DUF177 family)
MAPEWSHRVALDRIGSETVRYKITATIDQCALLAERFGLIAIARLEADIDLRQDNTAPIAKGQVSAEVTQACVATGVPVPQTVSAPMTIRFVDLTSATVDDIEIDTADHDDMEHDGVAVDLGEAAAQTLMLSLDPYPRSSSAAKALRSAGVIGEDQVVSGAFAALKGLLATPKS